MSRLIRTDKASRAAAYIKGSLSATASCIALKLFFRQKKCHAGILIISIPDRFCKTVRFVDHALFTSEQRHSVGKDALGAVPPLMSS
jgi:hypothetical protein